MLTYLVVLVRVESFIYNWPLRSRNYTSFNSSSSTSNTFFVVWTDFVIQHEKCVIDFTLMEKGYCMKYVVNVLSVHNTIICRIFSRFRDTGLHCWRKGHGRKRFAAQCETDISGKGVTKQRVTSIDLQDDLSSTRNVQCSVVNIRRQWNWTGKKEGSQCNAPSPTHIVQQLCFSWY